MRLLHNVGNILLNESHKQYKQNKARIEKDESPVYLKNTEQDKIVKDVLIGRDLVFNTKVIQQTNDFHPNLKPEETNKVGLDINISSIDIGNKDFHKAFNISNIKLNNLVEKNKQKIKRLQRKQSRRVLKKKKGEPLGKNFKKTQYKSVSTTQIS